MRRTDGADDADFGTGGATAQVRSAGTHHDRRLAAAGEGDQGNGGTRIKVLHIYGMTELQGPSSFAHRRTSWRALSADERATAMASQGVRYQVVEGHIVGDPKTCAPVKKDGRTMGEILVRATP